MKVRRATAGDAKPGSLILRRSITELCAADHGGDQDRIAAWTRNKTEMDWCEWTRRPDVRLYVAEEGGAVLGVGLATGSGTVLLNYVSPDARWRGVSTVLLTRMETDLAAGGCMTVELQGSITAAAFYRARGYRDVPNAPDRTLSKRLKPAVEGAGGDG